MPHSSRSRRSGLLRVTIGSVVALVAAAALVVVPSTPAFAIQTIGWTTPPPSTAVVGQQVSFAWNGTANTFLGARITGCFANFPDGGNYSNAFGGNFTTGSCNYTNRTLNNPGSYTITVGFTLSTGGTMSQQWLVNVGTATPTVITSGPVLTTATSVSGAPATFTAYGTDATYGTYPATCSPASGSTFPPGTSTVTCSATNPAGKTGSASLAVTVQKATPVLSWAPPSQVVAGRPLGATLDAAISSHDDAAGTITYADGAGNPLTSTSILSAQIGQVLRATYTPSGAAAAAYNPVTVSRTVDVVRIPQSVDFGSTPIDVLVGADPFEVTASGTADGGPVSIAATADSTCTVVDHSVGTAGAATVSVTSAGTCVLEASQGQTETYSAAPVAQHSITVARRTPAISWTPAGDVTFGASLANLLDATTDVPGTWTYRLNGVEVDESTKPVAGADQVLDVVFTPTDASRYTTATQSRVLDVLRASQDLVVAATADRTYGDAPFSVNATSDGPGDITITATGPCTINGTTVSATAAGTCEVTVRQSGDGNHLPAEVVRAVTIVKGAPVLSWGQPADLTYGEAIGTDQLDALIEADVDPSAVAPAGDLTYTLAGGDSADGAVLAAGNHTLHVRWEPTGISAERWKPVTGSVTLVVTGATATVLAWTPPDSIVYGTPLGADELDATVSATGATGTITYVLADGVTPADGAVLHAGAGQSITAHFEPDSASGFLPASRTVTIDVTHASLTVTTSSVKRRYGADNPALTASYSGFVNGDDAGDLTQVPTCSSGAGPSSRPGTYAIACQGASSPDYTVTARPASLRVRYGLRGFTRSTTAGDLRRSPRSASVPVRIALTNASRDTIPRALAAPIGKQCRATLRIHGVTGTTSCFRYDATGRRPFVAHLRVADLTPGKEYSVLLKVKETDGTVVRRRTIQITVGRNRSRDVLRS